MNQMILPFLSEKPAKKATASKRIESAESFYDLERCWDMLIDGFFPDRTDLKDYKLSWSARRQKRTLASCNIRARKVAVAKELNHPLHWHILEALLYHEMCHAVLGFSVKNPHGRSAWHGKEFKSLEARHPGILDLNQWIKAGGWSKAIRQDRGRFPKKRKQKTSKLKKLFRKFFRLSRVSWKAI